MLPPKLKNFAFFGNGVSYLGQCNEVTLPKLQLKTDDYRPGGLLGDVKADMGLDPQPLEAKFGGFMRQPLRDFGTARIDGVLSRFVGAYQAEDTGLVMPAELVVRGRWTEIDPGTAKAGDANEFSASLAWTYLKWSVAGTVDVEIDLLGLVFTTGGVDRYADIRAALLG